MYRSTVAGSALCAVACFASAGDRPPHLVCESISRAPALEVEVRDLGDTARVLTDNRGGWRLERYFSRHQFLVGAEDEYGSLVQVVRDGDGRPVGLMLGQRYALEYFYSRPGGPCERRILYEPRSGQVIAEVIDPDPEAVGNGPGPLTIKHSLARPGVTTVTVGGRPYAFLSPATGAPVIRSIEIDDPGSGTIIDRIDYTESHLFVNLSVDADDGSNIFTIPRHTQKNSQPTVIEISGLSGVKEATVWALAGRGRSATVPRPNLKGSLPSDVEVTLQEAFPRALKRVREVPSCRSLFEEFVESGNQRLTTTLYAPPNEARPSDSCDRGALAFTHVGSSITHLCAGFGGLDPDQATIVLIHEALHYAGMEEAPFYEGARTSREINELVFDRCGF